MCDIKAARQVVELELWPGFPLYATGGCVLLFSSTTTTVAV